MFISTIINIYVDQCNNQHITSERLRKWSSCVKYLRK